MSLEYDAYLKEHIANVNLAYLYIRNTIDQTKLNNIFPNLADSIMIYILGEHDESKYDEFEYVNYDDYFYHGGKGTSEGEKKFEFAFNEHIHKNKHHWQHWVLPDDDTGAPKALDMPDMYIMEMICDWWSFSWKAYKEAKEKNEQNAYMHLYDIFEWYKNHENKIIMTNNTKKKVEALLRCIQDSITQINIMNTLQF